MLQTNTRTLDFSLPDSHGITVSPNEYRGMRRVVEMRATDAPSACGGESGRMIR